MASSGTTPETVILFRIASVFLTSMFRSESVSSMIAGDFREFALNSFPFGSRPFSMPSKVNPTIAVSGLALLLDTTIEPPNTNPAKMTATSTHGKKYFFSCRKISTTGMVMVSSSCVFMLPSCAAISSNSGVLSLLFLLIL